MNVYGADGASLQDSTRRASRVMSKVGVVLRWGAIMVKACHKLCLRLGRSSAGISMRLFLKVLAKCNAMIATVFLASSQCYRL